MSVSTTQFPTPFDREQTEQAKQLVTTFNNRLATIPVEELRARGYGGAIDAAHQAILETRRYLRLRKDGRARDESIEDQLSHLWETVGFRLQPLDHELARLCYVKGNGWADNAVWDAPGNRDLPLKLDQMLQAVNDLASNPPRSREIRQKKLDALAAKYLHQKRLARLNGLNKFVDALAVIVPILYFSARYLAKGTNASEIVEPIWEVLGAILLASGALKLIYGWQEKAEQHSELIAENISLAGQADNLLSNIQNTSPDSIRWFLLLAEETDKKDAKALGIPKEKDRQAAYREALKEFSPQSAETVCLQCGASPWNYTPGSCQLCGNTPKPKPPTTT